MVNILKEPQLFFGLDGNSLPSWFAGFDSYIQLVFFIITLLIGIYAFKIYKLSDKRESYYLANGFLLISLSYLIWSVLNLNLIRDFSENLCEEVHICEASLITDVVIYLHLLLFISGLVTITYASFKTNNRKTYSLLLIILIVVLVASKRTLFFFYLLSCLLLIYLVWYYITIYRRKKSLRSLLMLIAFFLLFFGTILFLMGLYKGVYYMGGNLFILAAYILILVNALLTLKK